MVKKNLPPPRLFSLNHPKLIQIRNNFRKVIQLAIHEEWNRLMFIMSSLRTGDISPNNKKYYIKLTQKANYLKECFLNSIISDNSGYIGGTNIFGDRIRVYIVKTFEEHSKSLKGAKYVIKKCFFTKKSFEIQKDWLKNNYEEYFSVYRRHPEYFITFREFHFLNTRSVSL